MIVVDTNVISELMKPAPNTNVLAWFDDQRSGDIATTAITVAEILYGIASLPEGRRKRMLLEATGTVLDRYFRERVYPFDEAAATAYADLVVARDRAGRPISMADAQIAAICRSRSAALATRNRSDFEETGVLIVDPWTT